MRPAARRSCVGRSAPAHGRVLAGRSIRVFCRGPHHSAGRATALPSGNTAYFPKSPAPGESRNRACGRARGSPHRRSFPARRGAGSARHRSRTGLGVHVTNRGALLAAGLGCPVVQPTALVLVHSPTPPRKTRDRSLATFVARQFCNLTLGGFSSFLFAS